MDYQTQQLKLLPLIATSYALLINGISMIRIFFQVQSEIMDGNFDSLPEVFVGILSPFSYNFICVFFVASCNQFWVKSFLQLCMWGRNGSNDNLITLSITNVLFVFRSVVLLVVDMATLWPVEYLIYL